MSFVCSLDTNIRDTSANGIWSPSGSGRELPYHQEYSNIVPRSPPVHVLSGVQVALPQGVLPQWPPYVNASVSWSHNPNSYKLNFPSNRGVTRAIQSTRPPARSTFITSAARRSFHCGNSVSHSGNTTLASKRHFVRSPIALESKKSEQRKRAASGFSSSRPVVLGSSIKGRFGVDLKISKAMRRELLNMSSLLEDKKRLIATGSGCSSLAS